MEEVWLPVKDFQDYEVSNLGRIRNKDKYILRPVLSKNGSYPSVCLTKDKKQYSKTVHRLVGQTFLDNPNNLPTIDHIDRNRENNQISNLRWASISEQALNRNKRKIVIKPTNTGEHHISYSASRNRYIVQKRDIGINCKCFPTLEKAIEYRNSLLD